MLSDHDTIVAPATAPGGAIAVIRVSGAKALTLCDRIFRGRTPLAEAAPYTVHYGTIVDAPAAEAESPRIVDDVLATLAVMEEMEKERKDLHRYVSLFGYNPRYGIEGKAISSVTYKPKSYNPAAPLYET